MPLTISLFGAVVVGLVTWIAGPVLRHTPTAVLAWPVHGVALALLLAVRPRDRVAVAAAMLGTIAIGAAVHSGNVPRGIAAAAMMVAQSACVTLLHGWLARGRHPLRSVQSFAWFVVSAMVGVIPTTLLTDIVLRFVGVDQVPGWGIGIWWVAAVTSIAAITPILMAATVPAHPDARLPRVLTGEFPALMLLYALALSNAFLGVGAELIALPPSVGTVPFLIWAGLRFGVRGFAVAAALFLTAAIGSTFVAGGPFSPWGSDPMSRGVRAWIYVATLAGPTMIFPVALAERAAAEARARGAFAQLAAIIESSADLIAAVDRDLNVIAANSAWVHEFERVSGVHVRAGMRMRDALAGLPLDAEDSLAHWLRAIAGERFTVTREVGDPARARDEYEIAYAPVLDERGDIVGASQVVRNVSHRRRQEAAAADARRLEALGRLAGGVAHDFNNLMTAVIGYTGILAQSLPANDPRQADLGEIEKAASRAGELTQQLLAFARRRVVEPKLVDLGESVAGFMRLIAPLLGSTVRPVTRVASDLPPVKVDPVQFEQVLMNLAVNARDAMPSGGELTVEVVRTRYRDADGVRLSIRDTGHGMSPEVLSRIWEPFYTTKPLGKGTGLGLATVHGIVHQAGGEVSVESREGVGTTFHVLLPAAG